MKSALTGKDPGIFFSGNAKPYQMLSISDIQGANSIKRDKTIIRPSYLHNGISYTGKMTSLYWIGAQISFKYIPTDQADDTYIYATGTSSQIVKFVESYNL